MKFSSFIIINIVLLLLSDIKIWSFVFLVYLVYCSNIILRNFWWAETKEVEGTLQDENCGLENKYTLKMCANDVSKFLFITLLNRTILMQTWIKNSLSVYFPLRRVVNCCVPRVSWMKSILWKIWIFIQFAICWSTNTFCYDQVRGHP